MLCFFSCCARPSQQHADRRRREVTDIRKSPPAMLTRAILLGRTHDHVSARIVSSSFASPASPSARASRIKYFRDRYRREPNVRPLPGQRKIIRRRRSAMTLRDERQGGALPLAENLKELGALDKWFNNPKTITTAQMSPIIRAPGTLQRPGRSRNATFMFPVAAMYLRMHFSRAAAEERPLRLYRRYNDRDGAIMRQTVEMVTPRSLTSNSLSAAHKSSRALAIGARVAAAEVYETTARNNKRQPEPKLPTTSP